MDPIVTNYRVVDGYRFISLVCRGRVNVGDHGSVGTIFLPTVTIILYYLCCTAGIVPTRTQQLHLDRNDRYTPLL